MTPWVAAGIGAFLAAFNLGVWRLAILLAARGTVEGGGPASGGFFLVLAFLIKMPLIVLGGIAVVKTGQAHTTGFLAGFISVYCVAFGWMVYMSQDRP